MPDYNNGKIYTIRCRNDDTLIYVGSTCQSLSNRFSDHRISSRTEKCKNYILYKKVNGNWDNWYIELYELYPCDTKEQLLKREGEIIRLIGNLNKVISGNYIGRTQQEYDKIRREDKKEILAEQKKQYYETNKNKISAYYKEWKKDKIDVIEEYNKQYYENNKEVILRNVKEYRDNNKEKINEKITCSCGCEVLKRGLNRHMKSKKHLDLIQSVN